MSTPGSQVINPDVLEIEAGIELHQELARRLADPEAPAFIDLSDVRVHAIEQEQAAWRALGTIGTQLVEAHRGDADYQVETDLEYVEARAKVWRAAHALAILTGGPKPTRPDELLTDEERQIRASRAKSEE